jgi:hypothetical protein
MDMNDVMKLAIESGVLHQVSKKIGISDKEVNSAVEVILPMLIKGMQGQAKNKDTKDGFLKALSDHSKSDSDDVRKFIKDVDEDDGAKIVKHLLGSKTEEVAAKAKKKSGLDTKDIIKIMAIIAPLLMSQMGKTAKSEAKEKDTDDMSGIVGRLLDNVDVGDVIKIAGLLLK